MVRTARILAVGALLSTTVACSTPNFHYTVATALAVTAKPLVVKKTPKVIKIDGRIAFRTGRATLLEKSYALLDKVVSVLSKNPQIEKVEVQGHTDSRGNARRNLRLSQRRATAVVRYLVEQGVAARRLVPKGYGAERPVADNDTREGRSQNRRVEFHVVAPAPKAVASR